MSALDEINANWKHYELDWKRHTIERLAATQFRTESINMLCQLFVYPIILLFEHWYCFEQKIVIDVPTVTYDEYKQFIIESIPSQYQNFTSLAKVLSSKFTQIDKNVETGNIIRSCPYFVFSDDFISVNFNVYACSKSELYPCHCFRSELKPHAKRNNPPVLSRSRS